MRVCNHAAAIKHVNHGFTFSPGIQFTNIHYQHEQQNPTLKIKRRYRKKYGNLLADCKTIVSMIINITAYILRPFGYERVYLPPFQIQEEDLFL